MIKVSRAYLPGILKIERNIFMDHRGIYGEIYKKKEYFDAGITTDFVEQSFSLSRKNVLRGLHGDPKTWKLVSCPYGNIYLVVLNYNRTSSFFGQWESFALSPVNKLQILIPPMYANGHLVLSDRAIFHYNQSEYYIDGTNQFSVRWNDPRFNIRWPINNPILSERDKGGE